MKLNHVLIITNDLNAMQSFWTTVIGLEVGERPPFQFDGLWLYSDNTPFVHIAEQKGSSLSHGSIAHIAFEGANYKDLMVRLNKTGHSYTEKDVPLSNDRQVFVAGPNGVTVEMMFPLNEIHPAHEADMHSYTNNEDLSFLGGKK